MGPDLQRSELGRSQDADAVGLRAFMYVLPCLLLEISLRSLLTQCVGCAGELGLGIHRSSLRAPQGVSSKTLRSVSRPAPLPLAVWAGRGGRVRGSHAPHPGSSSSTCVDGLLGVRPRLRETREHSL